MALSHYQLATVPFFVGLVVGVTITTLIFEHKYLKTYSKDDNWLHEPVLKSKNTKRDIIPSDEVFVIPTSTEAMRIPHIEELDAWKSRRMENLADELDLKKQIYVGVITAEKYLPTRAKAVNNTWGSQVDKIEFFAEHGTKEKFNVPVVNLEGISDTEYPPQKKAFKMLKHMCKNVDSFEWFVRADDDLYIRVEKLRRFLSRFDSNLMVYMGQPGHGVPEVRDKLGLKGRNFCMGGPGVFFNRAAMKALCPHIDACIQEVVSTEEDVEIGRCVSNHIGIECIHAWETLRDFYHSYEEEYTEEKPFLGNLAENTHIETAITLHHVKIPYIMYKIHRHFATKHLNTSSKEIESLNNKIQQHNTLHSKTYESKTGQSNGEIMYKDSNMQPWKSFNAMFIYGMSTSTTTNDITNSYLADLKQICEMAIDYAIGLVSPDYTFNYLLGGYYQSNSNVGTKYMVDVVFTEKEGKRAKQIMRVNLMRPLSKDITKDTQRCPIDQDASNEIFIIIPTGEEDASTLEQFIMNYFEPLNNAIKEQLKVTIILSMLNEPTESNSNEPSVQDVANWYRIKSPDNPIQIVWKDENASATNEAREFDHAFTRGLEKAKTLSSGDACVIYSMLNNSISLPFVEYCNLKTSASTKSIVQAIPFQLHNSVLQRISNRHFSNNLLQHKIRKLKRQHIIGYWSYNRNNMNPRIDVDVTSPTCMNLNEVWNLYEETKTTLNTDAVFPVLFQQSRKNDFKIFRYVDKSLYNLPS